MRHLTNSALTVPGRYLVQNVTGVYARWWHTVVGATCGTEHISGLVLASKRKAIALEQTGDPPLFGESLFQKKKKRGGKKSRGKKKGPVSAF